MRLLAIDPGLATGIAGFSLGVMTDCGLIEDADLGLSKMYYKEGIIELPQIYRSANSKGDPNDLIRLAVLVGQYKQQCIDQFMNVRLVKPAEWKGQVPKTIHAKRILDRLNPRETELFLRRVDKVAPSKRHNVIDAIGIGLWAIGRDPNGRRTQI